MSAIDQPLPVWLQALAGAWLLAVVGLFLRQVIVAYLALLGG